MADQTNYNKPENKVVNPIAKGKKLNKKKTLSEKFSDAFITNDIETVKSYIALHVIVPAIKNLVVDIIENTVEMFFLDGAKPSAKSKIQRSVLGNIEYYKISDSTNGTVVKKSTGNFRTRNDLRYVVFDTEDQATSVLAEIYDLVKDYGYATVKDLYKMAQMTDTVGKWPLESYGWDSIEALSTATVTQISEGWLLTMPRPVVLDN